MPIWCGIHFISIPKQSRIELKSFKATHNFFVLSYIFHLHRFNRKALFYFCTVFFIFYACSLYQLNDFLENNLIQVVQLFSQCCWYVSPIFFESNTFLSLNRYFIFSPSQFTSFSSHSQYLSRRTSKPNDCFPKTKTIPQENCNLNFKLKKTVQLESIPFK